MRSSGDRRADVLALVLLACVVLAIHWRWFMPGLITDQDWYVLSAAQLHELFPSPSMFDLTTNLGNDNRDSLNYYPMVILIALVARLGASPDVAARLVVMFPTILLLAAGGYIFARTYGAGVFASTLAGLFYACNAYIDVVIARGQMTVAESVAWSAIALAACVRAIRPAGRASDAAAAALCLGLAFVCDVRIALLACTAAVPLCAVELRRGSLAAQLRRSAAVCGALVLLLAYVLVPTLASHLSYAPPADFGEASWLARLSFTSLVQALTFDHPLWYDNAFHEWRWRFAAFLIPVVAGFWVMLRDPVQRPRAAVVLALVAIGAVLVTGTLSWFGPLYAWLFAHTWYMHLFRDPSKFSALMLPGYALAFGVGAAALTTALPARWMRVAAATAFFLLALWPSRPILMGMQTQLYWPKNPNPDEARVARMLLADPIPSRVLWAPVPDRFVPADNRHPAVDELWFSRIAVDGASSLSDGQRLARALQSIGVGYVVVRRDESKALAHPPAYVAYRTIRTYATLGAFGAAVLDSPVLRVFKIGEAMRFSSDPALSALRVGGVVIPGVRSAAPAAPALHGPLRAAPGGIVAGGRLVRLPAGLRGAANPVLVTAGPPRDTLFAPQGALRVDGVVPEASAAIVRNANDVVLAVPDWNGYIDVAIRVTHIGANRPYIGIRTADATYAYKIRGASRPGDYVVMLPGWDLPRTLVLRAAPEADIHVTSAAFVPADYYGLIDPASLGRARPSRRISVIVPLAAALPAHGVDVAYPNLPLQVIREFPATLRGSGRASGTIAAPMAASPLWSTAHAPDASRAYAPSLRVGEFAAAELPPGASGVMFEYSVDRQLALGEILSLLAALALCACIIINGRAARETV